MLYVFINNIKYTIIQLNILFIHYIYAVLKNACIFSNNNDSSKPIYLFWAVFWLFLLSQ